MGGIMRIHFTAAAKILAGILLAIALFTGGYVAGQNKFGQPKTVLHIVALQWRPGVPDMQKQAAIDGIKDMAAKMPGIKNVWIKADRLQPRDFNTAFAIEFRSRDAADAYAESPLHEAWEKEYVPLRAASISLQLTNP
jgi:Stress responsive A/B Barrel Domain